jgi:NADP-dependent 3-hydroxy acid dehydrogenase YdfG
MSTLQHQVAVVTGASSGIGRAIAIVLAAQGVHVCLIGRTLETLQRVAAAAGPSASCYQADLEDDGELDELATRIARDVSSVDILVHAAGVMWWGPIESATTEQLDSTYRTNVRAPYVLTQKLLPQLKARQGQIVFVNSTAGLSAKANVAQYAASKHALKALADSLRDEVNPAGVRVLSLFLGRTASEMQAAVHASEGRPYHPELLMQPQDVAAVALHALGAPRSMEITDIHLRPMEKSY